MNQTQIEKIENCVMLKKSSIPILSKKKAVVDGKRYTTDVEHFIISNTDEVDGIYQDGIRLSGMDIDDYPRINPVSKDEVEFSFGFGLDDLKKAFKEIKPFLSTDELRPALTGIYFEYIAKDQVINVTGTNGHVLISRELVTFSKNEKDISFIAPVLLVNAILALPKEFDVVLLQKYGGRVVFKYENIECNFKCVEATYPNYAKVIPDTKDFAKFTFHTEQVIEFIDKCKKRDRISENKLGNLNILVKDDMTLTYSDENGEILTRVHLLNNNFDHLFGETNLIMPVRMDDEDVKMDAKFHSSINFNYWKTILSNYDTVTMYGKFKLDGVSKPMLIQGVES